MEMGNGKLGDEKMGIFHHNCIACPLCIQQHLLEWTSATGDSGEEVQRLQHMHQVNTQKIIIDRLVLCCMTIIVLVQDGQNLFVDSTSQQLEQLFQLSQSIQESCCTLHLNCRDPLPSEDSTQQPNSCSKMLFTSSYFHSSLALFQLLCASHILPPDLIMENLSYGVRCTSYSERTYFISVALPFVFVTNS